MKMVASNSPAPGEDSASELKKYLKHAKAGVDQDCSND